MRIDEASDLFYKCVTVETSNFKSALSRKEKHPDFKSHNSYFQVDR